MAYKLDVYVSNLNEEAIRMMRVPKEQPQFTVQRILTMIREGKLVRA